MLRQCDIEATDVEPFRATFCWYHPSRKVSRRPDSGSSLPDQQLRNVWGLTGYHVTGVKFEQAGPFAGTAAPRSVQRPLLKCAQFMCVARPCAEN
jgi:hypothetical protein